MCIADVINPMHLPKNVKNFCRNFPRIDRHINECLEKKSILVKKIVTP